VSAPAPAITCGLCGRPFAEDRGQAACGACPLHAGCRFVRCPRCGYENPVEPPWLRTLRQWLVVDERR
jgi:hypothetical protein